MYDHYANTENVAVTVSCTIIIQTLAMKVSCTITIQTLDM